MKCANCPKPAIYSLVDPRVSTVHYCGNCLPAHLRPAAAAGHLNLAVTIAPADAPLTAVESSTPTALTDAPKKRRKSRTAAADSGEAISDDELAAAVADGYNSDAADEDADGIVQDGTPFQRPDGDILVEYSEESQEEAS